MGSVTLCHSSASLLLNSRCRREEDREGQPPGAGLTAVATRTRATATAVGSRRATLTPMPTAPPTTTMGVAPVSTLRPLGEPSPQAARPTRPTPTTTLGPPRPNISKRRLLISKEKKKKKKTTKFKIVPHFY